MAQSLSQSSTKGFISDEPETLGFDLSSGSKWVYPENYARREYQFTIVQTALYNNTLVCLPTGLGKTFIAAVVMYNFWRWYPRGRVVFLAPTKPLVAQQINACHEIMGIPSDQTVELTGAIQQAKRRQAWTQKRVIFATPQTFQKDLQNDCVPCDLIKCVVIDEAHKALGKHSYCEIVRMLNEKNKFFRVLALSATPGSKIDNVREVIQNLLISELELRDDASPDITPYTNNRSLEKIIVNLGRDLNEFKDRYICIMDPHVRILVQNHILQGSTANISKGRIFMLMKQYNGRPQKAKNHGTIQKTLTILLTMYHAYELLVKHGLRAFYNFYMNHSEKFWLDSELELRILLDDIKRHIGDFPVIEPLPDGSIPDVPNDIIFGHNKFETLQNLLVQHFQKFSSENQSTRAIVFVEYRDIVNEVYVLLLQKRPLIRPQMFVGQAGQKQKEQLAALEDFRNNQVNVLISTSVGEEGLDVGEVDLIVCFDISSSTPTRLVQRMGRTGRKRNGRVVLLLTEGKEVQTLNQAMSKKDTMNTKILQSSNIASSLYQSSPRMVPENLTPDCHTMYIKALPKTPKTKPSKTAKSMNEPATSAVPGEKKRGRKKKNSVPEDKSMEPQASTSKARPSPKKSGSTQSSLMRFLTSGQPSSAPTAPNLTNSSDADSGFVLSEEPRSTRDSDDPYSRLRPSDVLLLTSDSHALDFLTLCAMRRSALPAVEAESLVSGERRTWLPSTGSSSEDDRPGGELEVAEDPFGALVVPSPTCLESISRLTLCDVSEESSRDDSLLSGWPEEEGGGKSSNQSMTPLEELSYDNFRDDEFQVLESKYTRFRSRSNSNSNDSYNWPQQKQELSTLDSTGDGVAALAPAPVEVDFEAILDEATSSSELTIPQDQLSNASNDNIFDELLEASDEDDLFSDLDGETTLQPGTTEQPTLGGKRAASQSPCRDLENSNKRQRLLLNAADSSDGEAVLGTPPKPRLSASRLMPPTTSKPESKPAAVTVFYPDSDEDLFDDLDFETQFSPDGSDSKANVTTVEQKSVVEEADDDRDAIKDFIREEEPMVLEEPNVQTAVVEAKEKDKDKIVRDEAQPCQSDSSALERDLELEDWDDFALAPVIVPNLKAPLEKFSSFFAPSTSDNSKASSAATRAPNTSTTKAQTNSSTGWISSNWQPKKTLSLKNLNSRARPSETKKPVNGLDVQKIYRVEIENRPSLRLFNLKEANRDKDGFALPGRPVNKALPIEKENARPLPKAAALEVSKRKEISPKRNSSVSPRFRRYHSESSLNDRRATVEKKIVRRRRKGRRRKLEFIDEEAEVSSDCDTSAGSSEEDEAQDLSNFVSYTQVHEDDEEVDMRAHYLQTMNRSPIRAGGFVIKEIRPRPYENFNVYSQPVSQIEDTYMHDSFCVGDETEIGANDSDEFSDDSILESIESTLESRRKKLKQNKKMKFKELENKRRQNKGGKDSNSSRETTNSSSSEDETEALRRQVLEESMLLKNSNKI